MTKEETVKLFEDIKNNIKPKAKLLLHACCAPCSCGVLPQLKEFFDITIYYYNPNIYPEKEYILRYNMLEELKKHTYFDLISEKYDEKEYLDYVKGLENSKEGGDRCTKCYELRMEKACKYAKENGFDFFTTTLSVSPYKNALKLNSIGFELEKKYEVKYLYSDFKKKDGYKESIRISKELGLYRQEYCGCRYSLKEREQ